jgi:hypothetical protein
MGRSPIGLLTLTLVGLASGCAHAPVADANDASTAGVGGAPAEPASTEPSPSPSVDAPAPSVDAPASIANVGRVCTQMGCLDGLHVELATTAGLGPGTYALELEADAAKGSCEVTLPLPPCDKGSATVCKGDVAVLVGESGCALDPAAHGFGPLTFKGAPARVRVVVRKGTAELGAATFTPTYRKVRPNGEGCGPVCQHATERLELKSP